NVSTDEVLLLLLPSGISTQFNLDKIEILSHSYHLYLSQKDIPPTGYAAASLKSIGYYQEVTLEDFPVRGKGCYLHLKMRKWINQTSGMEILGDWKIFAKGKFMTAEFAEFVHLLS